MKDVSDAISIDFILSIMMGTSNSNEWAYVLTWNRAPAPRASNRHGLLRPILVTCGITSPPSTGWQAEEGLVWST